MRGESICLRLKASNCCDERRGALRGLLSTCCVFCRIAVAGRQIVSIICVSC